MKKILFFTAIISLCTIDQINAQNYAVGDGLVVAANSGLRLRIQPNISAPTIKVLDYNDPVIVQPMNGPKNQYADRIQWTDGYWVKVKSGLIGGWVFDGFLTTLKMPDHENQLCINCRNIVIPLRNYINDNFPSECGEELTDSREDVTQYTSLHTGGLETAVTEGEGWYRAEFNFHGYRISEVLNLLRSMLVGKQSQSDFEDSLVFHQGRSGHLQKIEIKYFDYPVIIEDIPEGYIHLSSTVIDIESGLTQVENH